MKSNVWCTPKADMWIIICFSCNEDGSKVNTLASCLCALIGPAWHGGIGLLVRAIFLIFPLWVGCQVSLNVVHLLSVQTVSVASRLCPFVHVCWAQPKRKDSHPTPQHHHPGSSVVCKVRHRVFFIPATAFTLARWSRWYAVAQWYKKDNRCSV